MSSGDVVLDCTEALGADHMLNAACILCGCLFIYPQIHEPLGQHGMALVHGLSNFLPHAAEGDMALVIHEDITVFAEILHGYTDTGLGKCQLVGNVDGADIGVAAA